MKQNIWGYTAIWWDNNLLYGKERKTMEEKILECVIEALYEIVCNRVDETIDEINRNFQNQNIPYCIKEDKNIAEYKVFKDG